MRILLRAIASTYTGYGNDGIGLATALAGLGFDITFVPDEIMPPLPSSVTNLLQGNTKGKFDLLIHHTDPNLLESNYLEADISLGWSMWEKTGFSPEDYTVDCSPGFRERWQHFDGLIVYSDVSYRAFARVSPVPLFKLQGGFDPSMWPYQERDWNGRMSFFLAGFVTDRKGADLAAQAFSILKSIRDDFDATLTIKTTRKVLSDSELSLHPDIHIVEDAVTQSSLLKAYQNHHVLLAPSRGEGKNLAALEFGATGGAVIASRWSGHEEWMRDDLCFPVGGETKKIDSLSYAFEPSVEDLICQMEYVYDHREEAEARGRKASQVLPRDHSWEARIARLPDILDQLGTRGQRVAHKFREQLLKSEISV